MPKAIFIQVEEEKHGSNKKTHSKKKKKELHKTIQILELSVRIAKLNVKSSRNKSEAPWNSHVMCRLLSSSANTAESCLSVCLSVPGLSSTPKSRLKRRSEICTHQAKHRLRSRKRVIVWFALVFDPAPVAFQFCLAPPEKAQSCHPEVPSTSHKPAYLPVNLSPGFWKDDAAVHFAEVARAFS